MSRLALSAGLVAFGILAGSGSAGAQNYAADVPDTLLTPDRVETERLGSLRFCDGMPDEKTVTKVYDNLDFSRHLAALWPVGTLVRQDMEAGRPGTGRLSNRCERIKRCDIAAREQPAQTSIVPGATD